MNVLIHPLIYISIFIDNSITYYTTKFGEAPSQMVIVLFSYWYQPMGSVIYITNSNHILLILRWWLIRRPDKVHFWSSGSIEYRHYETNHVSHVLWWRLIRRPNKVLSDLIFVLDDGGHQFGGFFSRIKNIMLKNENNVKEYRYLQLCILD
jgi:hypothetical protein